MAFDVPVGMLLQLLQPGRELEKPVNVRNLSAPKLKASGAKVE
jgi:hypothetical protein